VLCRFAGGGVRIGWTRNGSHVEVAIEDEGPGISNTTNLCRKAGQAALAAWRACGCLV